jgi:hypothetical protein
MAMGPNPVIDDLDLGPPREILHAEALSLLVALGPVRLSHLSSTHLRSVA